MDYASAQHFRLHNYCPIKINDGAVNLKALVRSKPGKQTRDENPDQRNQADTESN